MFLVILLIIFGLISLFTNLKAKTYGSALERYIVSRSPQDIGDVERLTREFDMKTSQRNFL